MDLHTYLQRTGVADGADQMAIRRIEDALASDTPFSRIAQQRNLGLPLRALVTVAEGYLEFRRRQTLLRPLSNKAPEALADRALEPHQLRALQRVVTRLPEPQWEPGFSLWQRAFALALKDGEVKIDGTPGSDYDEYLLKRELLKDLAPHRWLRIRRGERAGALVLTFTLPVSSIREQADLLDLPATLLDDVTDALPLDLRNYLDYRAETEAIRAARSTYQGLLCSPPVSAFPVLAVAIGRAFGIAVLDGDGTVLHHEIQRRDESVLKVAQRHHTGTVVLPTRSTHQARLSALKTQLAKTFPVTQVPPAGLSAATEGLAFPRIVASAVVLGRRAISPLEEWSRMDPVRLGLVEFQADLNETRLRDALTLTRDIVVARGADQMVGTVSGPTLGLTRRRLEELRPGQMVEGVVTNITPFGAFVNLGLRQEGLIHISEMADRFVKDPAEVVRIGQVVLAKVLEIDSARGRISLSLRRQKRPSRRAARDQKRSQALADLNKLFKS